MLCMSGAYAYTCLRVCDKTDASCRRAREEGERATIRETTTITIIIAFISWLVRVGERKGGERDERGGRDYWGEGYTLHTLCGWKSENFAPLQNKDRWIDRWWMFIDRWIQGKWLYLCIYWKNGTLAWHWFLFFWDYCMSDWTAYYHIMIYVYI